jgi:hypothetical protein
MDPVTRFAGMLAALAMLVGSMLRAATPPDSCRNLRRSMLGTAYLFLVDIPAMCNGCGRTTVGPGTTERRPNIDHGLESVSTATGLTRTAAGPGSTTRAQ